MKATAKWSMLFFLVALFILVWMVQAERHAAAAQTHIAAARTHRSYPITRLYTGPDGKTHAERIEAPAGPNGVVHLMPVTGAEIHRSSPGFDMSWHTEARRQYVITISGHGELEVAGGQKIPVGPGSIELVEDATGQGHKTRVVGNEERVALWLPLADQPH